MENPTKANTPEHVRAENINRLLRGIENLPDQHREVFESYMNLKNISGGDIEDYRGFLEVAFEDNKGGDIALAFHTFENEGDPTTDKAKQQLDEIYQLIK